MTSNPHREGQPNPDAAIVEAALEKRDTQRTRRSYAWPAFSLALREGIAARRGQRFGTEKLAGGFYWARHPGGKWQPAHVIDWQETTGETLVELTGEETLWPADEMEIGPRIQPHEGDGK